MRRAGSKSRFVAVMLASVLLGLAGASGPAFAAEAQTGGCGSVLAPGTGNSTAGGGASQQCGDTLAILFWVMSLPQSGGGGGTGPGGATIPGAPGGLALAPPPVIAAVPPLVAGQFRPNEVLILQQPGATADIAQALARDYALQLEVFTPSRSLRSALVRFRIPDARPVAAVLAALSRDTRVRASQPNYLYRQTAGAAVPAGAFPQYALDLIGARQAAARSSGLRPPLVAVIDTGIDETHPDLIGAVRDRYDAVGDGHWDVGAHGTGIAGIIAARGQSQGVDPGAYLLSVRAFPAGQGDVSEATSMALLRGLDWASAQAADVVNMSLAGPPDPLVDAAVDEVLKAGIIVVAAAGNGGPDAPPAYPAAVKGVVAVTATDQQDQLFKGANKGAYIVVAAPGVDILSTSPGGGFALATGTSQAAAEVSGLLAILRALRPGLTPQAAIELLSRTAKDLGPAGRDDGFGAGRIDAAAAIDELGSAEQAGQ